MLFFRVSLNGDKRFFSPINHENNNLVRFSIYQENHFQLSTSRNSKRTLTGTFFHLQLFHKRMYFTCYVQWTAPSLANYMNNCWVFVFGDLYELHSRSFILKTFLFAKSDTKLDANVFVAKFFVFRFPSHSSQPENINSIGSLWDGWIEAGRMSTPKWCARNFVFCSGSVLTVRATTPTVIHRHYHQMLLLRCEVLNTAYCASITNTQQCVPLWNQIHSSTKLKFYPNEDAVNFGWFFEFFFFFFFFTVIFALISIFFSFSNILLFFFYQDSFKPQQQHHQLQQQKHQTHNNWPNPVVDRGFQVLRRIRKRQFYQPKWFMRPHGGFIAPGAMVGGARYKHNNAGRYSVLWELSKIDKKIQILQSQIDVLKQQLRIIQTQCVPMTERHDTAPR